MAVKYLLLVNMQGQTRVAKYSDHRLGGEQVRDPSHRKFFSSISSDCVCVCVYVSGVECSCGLAQIRHPVSVW